MRERGVGARGLVVVAMGKLGGREIGYGSDLDVFFVYDRVHFPEEDHEDWEIEAAYVKTAQRVIRLLSTPHGDGPGYELDTRLRPSGNQGLLVVSLDAFTRYHTPDATPAPHAMDWERQALLKARVSAGDELLGAKVIAVAHDAAYERGAPAAERVNHLRTRMERELAGERPGDHVPARYDLKLGRGGLVDVEFAVQWLQMKFGADRRVRTTETEGALEALEACGYLDPQLANPLRDGYRSLRRLEQGLRIVHGTSTSLIEEGAPGLFVLAYRMGLRDGPRGTAAAMLVTQYRAITRDVRAAYMVVLGVT
jgi:glutamate-ammonia-ligase adenylyltransferase